MELHDYLRVIRERKWIIIQAVIVFLAVAFFISYSQKPVYEATTIIDLKSRAPSLFDIYMSSFWGDSERTMETQMRVIKQRRLAQSVASKLGLDLTPEEIQGKIVTSKIELTSLMEIKIRDTDPKRAQEIANVLTEEYVIFRKETNIQEIGAARRAVYNKMQEVKEEIIDLGRKIADESGSISSDIQTQWNMATGIYVTLGEKYEQLRIDETLTGSGIDIIEKATFPGAPVEPDIQRNVLIALAGGLMFGFLASFGIEYLDNTIKNREDLERIIGLPILGQIPTDTFTGKEGGLVTIEYPKSAPSESFRTLRTNIRYLNYDKSLHNIIITSAGPQEGKTTTAANLAASIAQTGTQVILICGDLRKPALHKIFGIKKSPGLTNVLSGTIDLDKVIQDSGIEGLKIITSGPIPPNPAEMLASSRMFELLESLRRRADIILIDTPPINLVTDAAVLSSFTDGVILVTRAGITTKDMLLAAKDSLSKVTTKVLGVVFNDADIRKYGYYKRKYYYYKYGNYYGYGDGYYSSKKRPKETKKNSDKDEPQK